MKKQTIYIVLILLGTALIISNFLWASETMDAGFWLRIISNVLVVLAMSFSLVELRKKNKNLD